MILDKRQSYGLIREWVKGYIRSSYWSKERRIYLISYPICELCGTDKNIQVHHMYPVRWFPHLELYHYNFITLCREHHFDYGHFKNWKHWNPYIWQMVKLHKDGKERFNIHYDKYVIREERVNYKRIGRQLKKQAGKRNGSRR